MTENTPELRPAVVGVSEGEVEAAARVLYDLQPLTVHSFKGKPETLSWTQTDAEDRQEYRDNARAALTAVAQARQADLDAEITRLAAENDVLRASAVNGGGPCVYCTLPRSRWAECEHGFPGCPRGDDAMLCPHVGAELETADRLVAAEARIAQRDAEVERLRADLELAQAVAGGEIPEQEWLSQAEIGSLTRAFAAAEARASKAVDEGRRAGLEEAAKVAEAQPFYPDTHTGMRQQWVKDQIAKSIRALLTTEATTTRDGGGDE